MAIFTLRKSKRGEEEQEELRVVVKFKLAKILMHVALVRIQLNYSKGKRYQKNRANAQLRSSSIKLSYRYL